MATCLTPYMIENPRFGITGKDKMLPVPCGKCFVCRSRRASQWGFRLRQQQKMSFSSVFVTFTYNTPPMSKAGFMTLVKKDFQDFMKRLRRRQDKSYKTKYYACGEYGTNTYRPHFHAIMFDVDPTLIADAWGHGHVHMDLVNANTIGYTLKYMCKESVIPAHANDDRLPEFSLMSKGMGQNYLTPAMVQYHKADLTRVFVTLPEGVKVSMPRYYRDKIFTDSEKSLQAVLLEPVMLKAEKAQQARYIEAYGSLNGYTKYLYECRKSSLDLKRNVKDTRLLL